jgi:hypothetical protein
MPPLNIGDRVRRKAGRFVKGPVGTVTRIARGRVAVRWDPQQKAETLDPKAVIGLRWIVAFDLPCPKKEERVVAFADETRNGTRSIRELGRFSSAEEAAIVTSIVKPGPSRDFAGLTVHKSWTEAIAA